MKVTEVIEYKEWFGSYINSPTSDPTLAAKLRERWKDLTAAQHEKMLLDEAVDRSAPMLNMAPFYVFLPIIQRPQRRLPVLCFVCHPIRDTALWKFVGEKLIPEE